MFGGINVYIYICIFSCGHMMQYLSISPFGEDYDNGHNGIYPIESTVGILCIFTQGCDLMEDGKNLWDRNQPIHGIYNGDDMGI